MDRPPWMHELLWNAFKALKRWSAGETDASLLRLIDAARPWRRDDYPIYAPLPKRREDRVMPRGHFEVAQVVFDLLRELGHLELADQAHQELVRRVEADTALDWYLLDGCRDILTELDAMMVAEADVQWPISRSDVIALLATIDRRRKARLDGCPGDLAQALQDGWVRLMRITSDNPARWLWVYDHRSNEPVYYRWWRFSFVRGWDNEELTHSIPAKWGDVQKDDRATLLEEWDRVRAWKYRKGPDPWEAFRVVEETEPAPASYLDSANADIGLVWLEPVETRDDLPRTGVETGHACVVLEDGSIWFYAGHANSWVMRGGPGSTEEDFRNYIHWWRDTDNVDGPAACGTPYGTTMAEYSQVTCPVCASLIEEHLTHIEIPNEPLVHWTIHGQPTTMCGADMHETSSGLYLSDVTCPTCLRHIALDDQSNQGAMPQIIHLVSRDEALAGVTYCERQLGPGAAWSHILEQNNCELCARRHRGEGLVHWDRGVDVLRDSACDASLGELSLTIEDVTCPRCQRLHQSSQLL